MVTVIALCVVYADRSKIQSHVMTDPVDACPDDGRLRINIKDNECDSTKDELQNLPFEIQKDSRKLLILLDMNGTLLLRTVKTIVERKHDLKHDGKFYYIRENAVDLIKFLLPMDELRIAFYTSMRASNAIPALPYLLDQKNEIFVHVYDRHFNKVDHEGDHSWSTMRDLPKLWNCKNTPAFGHNIQNTLMIDDSFQKMREYPLNVLVVPEYTLERAESHIDDRLLILRSCLEEIIQLWNSGINDIREILILKGEYFSTLLSS